MLDFTHFVYDVSNKEPFFFGSLEECTIKSADMWARWPQAKFLVVECKVIDVDITSVF